MKHPLTKTHLNRSKRKILSEYMVTLIELAQMKEAIRTHAKLTPTRASHHFA